MLSTLNAKVAILILFVFSCYNLRSQNFTLVKDINVQTNSTPNNTSNNTTCFAVLNNKVYFAADDGIHGKELWSSDGTAEGTHMVKDIMPGSDSSGVNYIYGFNDKIYFFAERTKDVVSFWSSDGTDTGTVILADSVKNYSVDTYYPICYAAMGNTLFFSNSRGGNNEEIWKTDGTKTGTTRLANLSTATYNYDEYIANFTVFNNRLYFNTHTGNIWVTDGFADVHLFHSAYSVSPLVSTGSNLYFIDKGDIWQSQGDSASTVKLTNFNGQITSVAYLKNTIYFAGKTLSTRCSIYKYNPASNTKQEVVSDLDQSLNYVSFVEYNPDSLLFFSGTDTLNKQLLFASNGTQPGTVTLKADGYIFSSLYVSANKLYFSHYDKQYGDELWVSNGSAGGTQLIKDINPGIFGSFPSAFTAFGESIVFSAATNSSGRELWKTDGTLPGTQLLRDINTSSTASSLPFGSFRPADANGTKNKFLFFADDGIHGTEFWASDGSNTALLADAFKGSYSASGVDFGFQPSGAEIGVLSTFKNADYFFAFSDSANCSLWKTNGQAGGTLALFNIPQLNKYTQPTRLGSTNSALFFTISADNSSLYNLDNIDSLGERLYAYNGTSSPFLLKKGVTSPVNLFTHSLTGIGNNIYFFSLNFGGARGLDLWKSDGTVAGTTLVKNIYSASQALLPETGYSAVFRSNMYFQAQTGIYFPDSANDFTSSFFYLWKSDGTPEGTVPVTKTPVSTFVAPTVSGNKLYYASQENTNQSLYAVDSSGLTLQKINVPNSPYLNFTNFIDVGGTLYFITEDYSRRFVLWKTDGTDTGTVKISDDVTIIAGDGISKLYFIKNNTIWQCSGNPESVKQVITVTGSNLQYLSGLSYVNGCLYFKAYSYQKGVELYVSTTSLLPVKWISFTGQLEENNTLLQWETANEQTSNYFNIQRSLNGFQFTNIDKVNANGHFKISSYNYTDRNIANNGVSKIYYRLKEVDDDGTANYSNIISINIPAIPNVHISPNPASKVVSIYSSVNMQGAYIILSSSAGQVLYKRHQDINTSSKINIPVSGYAQGSYNLIIQAGNNKPYKFKLIITK